MAFSIIKTLRDIIMPGRERRFAPMYRRFTETKTGRTRELYECTLRRMQAYEPRLERLRLEDITHEWLAAFDTFLAESAPSRNARNIHLRNVRTVYHLALNEGLTERNPFRRFKIRPEPTRKRALTIAQLRRLATAEVKPWEEKYRDAFVLMFMMRGINVADFCRLGKPEGGFIRYRRRKTGSLLEIRVEPEMRPLLERLKGEGQLLYPLDRVKDYRRYTARLNKALQGIAARLGLPPITPYWARHTWATVAAGLDIPKETIAAGLGHAGGTVTDIYIDFDHRKTHAANRKVIRKVFGDQDAPDK